MTKHSERDAALEADEAMAEGGVLGDVRADAAPVLSLLRARFRQRIRLLSVGATLRVRGARERSLSARLPRHDDLEARQGASPTQQIVLSGSLLGVGGLPLPRSMRGVDRESESIKIM
mgnify:CR=1 FL=1